MKNEITKEEMSKIIENDDRAYTPVRGVIFSKNRLERAVRRLMGPEPKIRGKKSEVVKEEIRDFISEEERDMYFSEFGPFTAALLNDEERDYCRERKRELFESNEFEIDPHLDMNIIMMCIMDEIILQRLYRLFAENPTASMQNQITNAQKRLRENLEALDATRRQRNKTLADERAREQDREISIATISADLEKTRMLAQKRQEEYLSEEDDLIKKVSMKSPPEVDTIDILVGEVDDDKG